MHRVIVTMNSGGTYIPRNVLESHQEAAGRWHAEYLQLTVPAVAAQFAKYADDVTTWNETARQRLPFIMGTLASRRGDVFYDKVRFMASFDASDRCAWIDGDVLIRSDAPNPFDIVPRHCIGGVANYQGDTHDQDPLLYHLPAWETLSQVIGVDDVSFDEAMYLNGGVVLWTPDEHARLWQWALDQVPRQMLMNPMGEQTSWNIGHRHLGIPVHVMSPEMNKIGPAAFKNPMTAYLAHLARFKWNSVRSPIDRDAYLQSIDWRAAA